MKVIIFGSSASSMVNFRGALIRGLVDRGYEVVCVAPDFDKYSSIASQVDKLGATAMNVSMSRSSLSILGDVALCVKFALIINREHPDIIISYTAKPVVWATLAGYIFRVPRRVVLITGLGYAFIDGKDVKRRFVKALLSVLYFFALRAATHVFCQNQDDADYLKDRNLAPSDKSVCVVNGSGVDIQAFQKFKLPDKEIVFLMISRLLFDKGIKEYFAAAKLIKKKYPPTKFLLVGDLDSNPKSLKSSELKVLLSDGCVEWIGPQKDIPSILAKSSVYVLPSYREGMPRTVLEAMACGRPIITTDVPGCRQTVIQGKNGFLVPARDHQALASAMERCITEPSTLVQMGHESRILAETRFEGDDVANKMIAFIER